MTGDFPGCCARAARGANISVAIAPPSRVMNSRRLTRLPLSLRTVDVRHLKMKEARSRSAKSGLPPKR